MASIVVELPDEWRDWLASRVGAGFYADEAAYILDLIQQDQARRSGDAGLAAALVQGERSGTSRRLVPDILAGLMAERSGDAA